MTNPIAKLRVIVASTIVAVWVGTLLLDILVQSYEIPPTVHGLMFLVAGFLFGPSIGRRSDGKDTDNQ